MADSSTSPTIPQLNHDTDITAPDSSRILETSNQTSEERIAALEDSLAKLTARFQLNDNVPVEPIIDNVDNIDNSGGGVNNTQYLQTYLQHIPLSSCRETDQWDSFQNRYRDGDRSQFNCHAIEYFFKNVSGREEVGSKNNIPSSKQRPLALRLQSYSVITHLHDLGLAFKLDDFEPIVMTHPFKWLFHNFDKIIDRLKILEQKEKSKPKPLPAEELLKTQGSRGPHFVDSVPSPTVDVKKLVRRPTTKQNEDRPAVPQNTMGDQWLNTHEGGSRYCTCDGCREKHRQNFLAHDNAFQDMKVLADFTRKFIEPKRNLAKGLSSGATVAFSDLWYIFQPGAYICTKGYREQFSLGEPFNLDDNGHQNLTVWKIHSTAGGYWRPQPNSTDQSIKETTSAGKNSNGSYCPLQIKAYCIDFDASVFGAVQTTFELKSYAGEREITNLDVFPFDCLKNNAAVRKAATDYALRLTNYRKSQKLQHQYYEGRAFFAKRNENSSWYESEVLCHPEDVDSPVIVDIVMAQQEYPEVGKRLGLIEPLPSMDDNPDFEWAYESKSLIVRELTAEKKQSAAKVVEEVYSYLVGNEDEMDTDIQGQSSTFDLQETTERFEDVDDADLILLPSKVFAFVLRARKFALVELSHLTDLPQDKMSFESLVIDPNYKKIVEAAVFNHFHRKKMGALPANSEAHLSSTALYDNDIIRGKGRGLVILLHGAPGVGKTSTAECIAAKFGRPLLPITCADLGTNAASVEAALDKIFNYAYRWDCILLLDEADVFLSSRTAHDITRNGLVSVFLRILEYYRGILFLTTNRVGQFDEAFKSRIHLVLHYPPLDRDQTVQIWRLNLKRNTYSDKSRSPDAHMPFGSIYCSESDIEKIEKLAKTHFQELENKYCLWNARQIRNAIRTAISLAEFSYDKKSKKNAARAKSRPALRVKHIQTVMAMSDQFDDYLKKTHNNRSAGEIALSKGERVDSYGSKEVGNESYKNAGFSTSHLTGSSHQQSYGPSIPRTPSFEQRNSGFPGTMAGFNNTQSLHLSPGQHNYLLGSQPVAQDPYFAPRPRSPGLQQTGMNSPDMALLQEPIFGQGESHSVPDNRGRKTGKHKSKKHKDESGSSSSSDSG